MLSNDNKFIVSSLLIFRYQSIHYLNNWYRILNLTSWVSMDLSSFFCIFKLSNRKHFPPFFAIVFEGTSFTSSSIFFKHHWNGNLVFSWFDLTRICCMRMGCSTFNSHCYTLNHLMLHIVRWWNYEVNVACLQTTKANISAYERWNFSIIYIVNCKTSSVSSWYDPYNK